LKKIPFIAAVFLFSLSCLFPQGIEIKSLKVYSGNNEASFPIIVRDGNRSGKITIEFDVKSNSVPNFSIIFKFCNKNWIPYDNLFLLNQGKNTYYNLHFSLLPNTVKAANYHFIESFPDGKGYVDFPFSGNWMFFITDSQDTSLVYGSGKFFSIRNDVALNDTITNEQLNDKIYFPTDLAKVFNITTSFYLPANFVPSHVNLVEVIENQKIDYPFIITRNNNTDSKQYFWNGDRQFSFVVRNVLPGNEYRQVDLRDSYKYAGPNVNAHLDGMDYSRFFQEGGNDLFGGSILTNYDNAYADYLNVTFSIRPQNEIKGGVWLVGAFNSWLLNKNYEMEFNNGVYSITIPLKRGIYDYQYVTASLFNGQIVNPDWVILEGNSWQTSNLYQIFLYYRDQNFGGYDRIIGYQQIMSNDKWKN